MESILTDVLVVGGGFAGCSAAIESSKYSAVTMVVKGKLGGSGSSHCSGGTPNVYLEPELGGHPDDSVETFCRDIVLGGDYINDQEMLYSFASDARQRFLDTVAFGVPYKKHCDGRYKSRQSLGMSYPRVGPVEKYGSATMSAFRKEVFHRRVNVIENVIITKILTNKNRAVGAVGIEMRSGELYIFRAKSVILASGGATGMYPYSSAAFRNTGDSYALAYDLGLSLRNMEFVEFSIIPAPRNRPFPTGGIKSTLAGGAKFYNSMGERFLEKYDPERLELTTRSCLVYAIYNEIAEGRGPCLLDATMLTEITRPMIRIRDSIGFNYKEEKIPYLPAVHTNLGGVTIDSKCSTEIGGLYAAGEAAGHGGVFGADRVNGAIAACFVFGNHAGRQASQFALENDRRSLSESIIKKEEQRLAEIGKGGVITPYEARLKLQNLSLKYIGVVRDGKRLEKGLEELESVSLLDISATKPAELVELLEFKNLVITARIIATAASVRKESRGQHQRKDYADRDDSRYLEWIVLSKSSSNDLTVKEIKVPIEKYPIRP